MSATPASPLSAAEVEIRLARLPEWHREGNAIRRAFRFPDFVAAMAFVQRVADIAERADHHPDIDIRYGEVTLTLSTHRTGGLTSKDFELAAYADAVAD